MGWPQLLRLHFRRLIIGTIVQAVGARQTISGDLAVRWPQPPVAESVEIVRTVRSGSPAAGATGVGMSAEGEGSGLRQLKSCGVLIVQGQPLARFLLMEHTDRLDLPKGHVEPGETEIETALRELEEETGLSRDAIDLAPGFRFTTSYNVWPKKYGGQQCRKTTVIFLGRLQQDDVPITVSEHVGYRWWDWQPPHRIQAATIDPLLHHLERYLRDQQGEGE